jgi:hypothetical protein
LFEVQLGKMMSVQAKAGANQFPYLRNENVHWLRFDLSDVSPGASPPPSVASTAGSPPTTSTKPSERPPLTAAEPAGTPYGAPVDESRSALASILEAVTLGCP